MPSIISEDAVKQRTYWIGEIDKLSGSFGDDSTRMEVELGEEIKKQGIDTLVNHLRLCGDIPESYDHDSSQEKLYSKYTDCVVAEAFKALGLRTLVVKERADTADVEVFAASYSFVADAKAFRLSRTAKNQKDFKVTAMDTWKRGKKYALLVCPIYQLPARSSQIYEQATSRNVCIFTYSHLAIVTLLSKVGSVSDAQGLLTKVFESVPLMNPSKDAISYWTQLNKVMFGHSSLMLDLWNTEKRAAIESIKIAKDLALNYLASEREKIMRMSHEDALKELIRINRIESRIQMISSVSDNGILDLK